MVLLQSPWPAMVLHWVLHGQFLEKIKVKNHQLNLKIINCPLIVFISWVYFSPTCRRLYQTTTKSIFRAIYIFIHVHLLKIGTPSSLKSLFSPFQPIQSPPQRLVMVDGCLCIKLSSFLHVCPCAMQLTFLHHVEFYFRFW